MKKKMLLVGIGDYNKLAPELVAPTEEIERWEQLLKRSPYELELICPPLLDHMATKTQILDWLKVLLTDAQDGDQLVMIFCGHGSNDNGEVLLAYPDGGTLESGAIRKSDFEAVLAATKPSAGADITIILEACFAGSIPPAVPLFAPLKSDATPKAVGFDASAVHDRFSDLTSWNPTSDPSPAPARATAPLAATVGASSMPAGGGLLFITAARGDEPAFQVHEGGNLHRLLFSMRAQCRLKRNQDSGNELIQNINPLRCGFPQHAEVKGSDARKAEKIPGDSAPSLSTPMRTPQVINLPWVRMRFLGMGTFLPREGSDPFMQRIVVPLDERVGNTQRHEAFVEVAVEDLGPITGTVPRPYYRGGNWYQRWNLTEHVVSLENADTTHSFTRATEFDDHVPLMTDVCPELLAPRAECRATHPDPTLFTAFFDLQSGGVVNGVLEANPTLFERLIGGGTTTGPIYTPTTVVVTQHFNGPEAILTIADNTGVTARITITAGATILVGNARELDITGPGTGDSHPENFLPYYKLVDPYPASPAVPMMYAAPINACSVTRFP